MKFKFIITLFILTILINPIFALDLEDVVDNIKDRAKDYDSEDTDICQFLVFTNYEVAKYYDYKEKNENNNQITKSEINSFFNEDILKIDTKDFTLRIEPWENRDDSYSLLFGLQPTQKQMDNAFSKGEEQFIEEYLENNPDANILEDPIKVKIDDKEIDCKTKLDFSLEIRKKFENCMPDFANWYFDLLSEDLDYYFLAGSGYEFVIDQINENSKMVLEQTDCLNIDNWPNEFSKIDVDYEDGKKILKIWEEKNVDNSINKNGIWATYYSYLNFPTKSEMKEIISTKVDESLSKGVNQEINNKSKDYEKRIKNIEKVSSKYGGSLDLIIHIKDDTEPVLKKLIHINPTNIMLTEDILEINEENIEKDLSIIIDFDELYDFLETISVDVGQVNAIAPRWVEKPKNNSNSQHVLKILTKTFTSWTNIIKIKPITEIPKLLFNLSSIINALGD